jgi:hypothetical protein
LTKYPWDEEDSLDGLDAAAIGHFAEDNPSGAPNNRAGIYSESTNNAALKFGIGFTRKSHQETEFFKVCTDTNALHYPIVRLLLL